MRDEVIADVAERLAESSSAGASAATLKSFSTCNCVLTAVSFPKKPPDCSAFCPS